MSDSVIECDNQPEHKVLTRGHKKKARTKQQLIEAALRIYSRAGVGGLALHALADEAGVSNGTVYNYFRTQEDVLEAVSIELAEQLSRDILAMSVGISVGAERMSIGIRTFLCKAQENPEWASALISVVRYAQGMRSTLASYMRHDLRTGVAQGDFKYANEEIALIMIVSATIGAMNAIVEGHINHQHDRIFAEMLLLALGTPPDRAKYITALPRPSNT